MLEEILRLQLDPDSGRREFRVRPEMLKKACTLMQDLGTIDREVTYGELMGQTAKTTKTTKTETTTKKAK